MKTLQVTKQFKKDVKRLKNQGKDFTKLKVILETICEGKKLKIKFRDHKLVSNYQNARECHIEPDWLLIYEIFIDFVKLRRTGSHAELFKK
jgi:mRNA interferase YafQ